MSPHMRAIKTFLVDEIGAVDVVIANGGKHPRVLFWYGGREHRVVVSKTPTNADDCARRVMGDIRRSLGLVDHEKRVGEKRNGHSPARRRRAGIIARGLPAPVLSAPPQRDWRERVLSHPAAAPSLPSLIDDAWRRWFRDLLTDGGRRHVPLLRPLKEAA